MDYSGLFDYIRDLYADFSFDKKSGNIRLPMRYILELTYRCNLNCPFCYITENRNIEELSVEEWLNVIDQIPPFSIITLCAGEVLLKEGFDIIYKKASEKGRKVTLITNGLKLDETTIDLLIKHKLFLLSVSLDAIGEKHDKTRNHPGLYNKIMNNLNMLNEKRHGHYNPMLDIKTCVLENNLDDIPLLYKEAMKLKAKFFSLTFIRKQSLRQNSKLWEEFNEEFTVNTYPIEPYFDMQHFKEIYKELESMQKGSKTILRYAPRFNPTGDADRIERFFNSGNTPVAQLYKPCKIPMTSIYITPRGDIYPCLSYKVGNLKEMKLKNAINTTKFKCFRKNLYRAEVFNACQMCCDARPKIQ